MSTLVLVPSPLRAARASRRLCDAEGGVLFGPRVLSLAQLAPALIAAGGESAVVLTPLAERLLAIEAARAAGLLAADARADGGAARTLAAAVRELRAAEVPPAALRDAAGRAPGASPVRLELCARLLDAYERRLAELGALDGAATLASAAAALQRGVRSEEVRGLDLLVLDGIVSATPAEWRLLSALASVARRTHARVPFFPERPDVAAAEPLLRSIEGLHASARGEIEVRLEEIAGQRSPALATALLSIAGGPGGEPFDARGDVAAFAGAGEDDEAAIAAEQAARWIDAGIPAEEILVLAPSPPSCAGRLAREFAARGVPFAAGVGEALSDVPVVRAVLRAVRAAARGLDRAALEELLASTYVTGALPPARLRELLDRAGALDGRGDPEDVLRRRAAGLSRSAREKDLFLRAAEAISDLKQRLSPLGGAARPREHAARLRAFVDAGVRRRAARGDPALARRDVGALQRLDERCEALVTALAMTGRAGAAIGSGEWLALVELAAGGGFAGPGDPAGGAVELWPVAESAGLSCRAAVVTACTRGELPSGSGASPLLRDAERSAVNGALGRAALSYSGRDRADALHAAFCALAAPRDALALTWPATHGGGAPAPLVSEVLAAVGQRLEAGARRPVRLSEATTAADALRSAARSARAGTGLDARAALASASAGLASRLDGALERSQVERRRSDALAARVADEFAGRVPAGPLLDEALPAEWSPSQLETDARCPFRFFLETPCRLAAPDDATLDVTPRDEGKVLHLVLERFLAGRIRRGAAPLQDDEPSRAELREAADAVFEEMEATGRLGDPALWPARRDVILARLERVLGAEAAIAASEGLQPRLVEHAFGGDGALVFSDGAREVRLCGRIDRIDASGDRLRVVDWKSGRANAAAWREKVDPDSFGDTSFQLPAYLMAAARALPGRSRLGATYVFLRSASRSAPFETDAADPVLATEPADRERLRDAGGRAFADAVIERVDRMRQGRFPIAPRECAGCGFGAVCRAEGSEEDDA